MTEDRVEQGEISLYKRDLEDVGASSYAKMKTNARNSVKWHHSLIQTNLRKAN